MPAPVFNLPVFGTGSNRYATEETFESALNTALSDLWSGVLTGSGKTFRSRSEAVAFGQAELPGSIGFIMTLEGGVVNWRVPFQNADDPLFATSPFWGVVSRVDVAAALRDTGVITLANVAGSADAITAELPAAARRNGVADTSATSIVEIIPALTNTGAAEPTLAIDGGAAAVIKSETGAALAAGQLIGGRSYLLRRRGGVWRIVSGAVALADLAAEAGRAVAMSARGDILMPSVEAGATAQTVTLSSDPSQAHILPALSRKVQIRWPVTNTGPDPVATLDGVPYTIKGKTGGDLGAGDLVGNGIYLATFFSLSPGVLRLLDPVRIDDINGLRGGLSEAGHGLKVAQRVQSQVSARVSDLDYMSGALVEHQSRVAGQPTDMTGMMPTGASGSLTMVMGAGASPRFSNGGVIEEFTIYLTSATQFSVSSWTEDVPGTGTTFKPYDVKYFEGVEGWNTVQANVAVPKGGLVGWGTNPNGSTGVNNTLPIVYVRATSAVENEEFTAESTLSFRFMVSFKVKEPVGINIPQGNIQSAPRALIDKRFTDGDGWTLAGVSISSGALVSGANEAWTARCQPTDYPYSQLSRRTFSAFADIISANQVWGISSIRMNDGHALNAPAAIVDGVEGMLRVYQYDGHTQDTPTTVADEVEVPWTLAGSSVRLDIKRVRFAYSVTLTNRVTGQSVSLTLDYAVGTDADSGRPWGIPCILFPLTAAGGVRVTRARYVADYPFPAGSTARVVCIGDSITEASQIGPDYDEGWAYLLEDKRAEQGARDTIISARGGQKSDGAAAAVSEVLRLCGPDTVVVILIGTNDAGIASGSRTSWRENVQSMLDQLQTRTQRIALCMLPPGPASAETKRGQINEDILSGYFPGLLPPVRFDLALSLNNDGVTWNPIYRNDATHPNVAGNAAMLDRLRLDCPEVFE